jgi:plasmid stabilization system protein ParE
MAVKIIWSDEAQATYEGNISYLQNEWSEKEVTNFVSQTWRVLKRLEVFPESYPIGIISKKYRKAKLNKYIVVFYSYNRKVQTIKLITFWNVKQNPFKMK